MTVAALYDIHGNLPALEAVLREVHEARVYLIVVGGDVLPGPLPRETIGCLLDLDIETLFIYGNGDVAVLQEMSGKEPALPEQYRPMIRWNAQQLSGYEQLMSAWPLTQRVAIDGLGEVLFCHATPRNENDIFTKLTAETLLVPIFEGVTAELVVCGHTHMQFDRMVGKTRVVNAGSIGMPFGQPGADWLLLGPDVQLRHTSYDLSKAAEGFRSTTCPQADEFFVKSVLQPPAERDILEVYSKAELK
jgi:predicted phosphodiesterase